MTAAAREPAAVVVTGLGLVTAAGIGVKETWSHITTASAPLGVRRPPSLQDLPCDFMYTVGGLDIDAVLGVASYRLMDRFAQLAVVAAREAVADAQLGPDIWDSTRVAVVIGSAHGGLDFYDEQHRVLMERGARRVSPRLAPLTVVNGAAGSVARDLGAMGPSLAVATACSSGTDAIGTALHLLRAGACDIAITGGAESMSTRAFFAGDATRRHCPPEQRTPPGPAARSTWTGTASWWGKGLGCWCWNVRNTPGLAAPCRGPSCAGTGRPHPAMLRPPSPRAKPASSWHCAPRWPTPMWLLATSSTSTRTARRRS